MIYRRRNTISIISTLLIILGGSIILAKITKEESLQKDSLVSVINTEKPDEMLASSVVFVDTPENYEKYKESKDNMIMDLTFIKPELPIIEQLSNSEYRALFIDDSIYLCITKNGIIQVSEDKGKTWFDYPTNDVTAEFLTIWLYANDPNPDGYSRREMLNKIDNGAKISHAIFKDGKEMYFIIGNDKAQIELYSPEKLDSIFLDSERMMITFKDYPYIVSAKSLRSFYDVMILKNILTEEEAEQEYNSKTQRLKKDGLDKNSIIGITF